MASTSTRGASRAPQRRSSEPYSVGVAKLGSKRAPSGGNASGGAVGTGGAVDAVGAGGRAAEPTAMLADEARPGAARHGIARAGLARADDTRAGVAPLGLAQPGMAQPGVSLAGAAIPGVAGSSGERRGVTVRMFGQAGRVAGLDAARGIAVVLLLAALALWAAGALGSQAQPGPLAEGSAALTLGGLVTPTGSTLTTLGDVLGLAAALVFAVVAGAAASVAGGGYEGLHGVAALRARMRIMVRVVALTGASLVVFGCGWAVSLATAAAGTTAQTASHTTPSTSSALATPILLAGGLLAYVGVMSLCEVLFSRAGSALLFTIAGACAVLAPAAAIALATVVGVPGNSPIGLPSELVGGSAGSAGSAASLTGSGAPFSWPFEVLLLALPWVAVFPAGMAVGRLRLKLIRVRLVLLGGGLATAAIAFGGVIVLSRTQTLTAAWFGLHPELPRGAASYVGVDALNRATASGIDGLTRSPESALLMIGSIGILLALFALCLLAAPALRWPALVLTAPGSLALSIGALVVAASIVWSFVAVNSPLYRAAAALVGSLGSVWLLAAALVGAASSLSIGWRAAFGPGLAERLLEKVCEVLSRSGTDMAGVDAGTAAVSTFQRIGDSPAGPHGFEALVDERVAQAAASDELSEHHDAATPTVAAGAPTFTAEPASPATPALASAPLPGATTFGTVAAGTPPTTQAFAPKLTPTPQAPASEVPPVTLTVTHEAGAAQPGAPEASQSTRGDAPHIPPTRQAPAASSPQPAPHLDNPTPAAAAASAEPPRPAPAPTTTVRTTWSPGRSLGRLPY